MVNMQIKDSLTLDASGLSRTRDGYLVGQARVSRAGNVQRYFGHELNLDGDDAGKVFGVYRDPETVFDEASMASLAGRPVTRGHPPFGVTADTWKDLSVGAMGGKVVRDGEHVVASMAIMDATAADEVEAGARALSAGYTVGIVKDEGVAADGTPYQYRQTGPLRFNHVAYLPGNNPRAGNTRIGDADARNWGLEPAPITMSDNKETPMSNDALKTVVLGDKAPKVAAEDAGTVEAWRDAMNKRLADQKAEHETAIAAKDEEIGSLKADLKAAKDEALTPEKLDAAVADRVALVTAAKAIDKDLDPKGMTDAEIRKAAVAKKFGDEMVKDASDAEIAGMFKAAQKDAKADPVKDAIKGGGANVTDAMAVKNAAFAELLHYDQTGREMEAN